MKKFLLFLASVLPSGLLAQTPAAGTGLSDAAAKALPAVVRVQTFLSDRTQQLRPGVVALLGAKAPLTGSASGVLVSAVGEVITNAHVLAGGDSIIVILPDHRSFRAVLAGYDDAADLALLKIQATGLPYLELGDPALVRIGDPVLAVGNPLDLNSTVTAGILSARFREMDDPEHAYLINSYLQTDAASNEGMSGSALVDQSGKLIGINAAILSPNGTFAGYAFAIPSGIVKKAWQELARYGQVRHSSLDLVFSDRDTDTGLLVSRVKKGGAAEGAGVKKEDILLQINGQPLVNAAQLRELVAQQSPGDLVILTVSRHGAALQLEVLLAAEPTGQAAIRNQSSKPGPARKTLRH